MAQTTFPSVRGLRCSASSSPLSDPVAALPGAVFVTRASYAAEVDGGGRGSLGSLALAAPSATMRHLDGRNQRAKA